MSDSPREPSIGPQPASDSTPTTPGPWRAAPTLPGQAQTALQPGTVLAGRYRVEHLIGTGGMGEVWQAVDLSLGEAVAIKTIRPGQVSSEALERLRSEVRLARRVSNRHVCRVFEFGEHSTPPGPPLAFLVMELLRGELLSQRLERQGPLPATEALKTLRQLALGLDAAHASGVVHRDLKPNNVFLEADERAVIADFGIARAMAGEPRITAEHQGWLGTPAYMAPEQVIGGPVGPQTDVFALGVLAFELVTGEFPFVGEGQALAQARLHQSARRLARVRPGLPAHWDDVLQRALARQPSARYPSASALVEALAVPPLVSRPWILGLALAALVGVAFGALAFVLSNRPTRWKDLSTANAKNDEARRLFGEAMAAYNARSGDARGPLKRALELDPGFVEASLQLAYLMQFNTRDEPSEHLPYFQRAMSQRSRLVERDRQLLDAMEPSFRDPPDWGETEARVRQLSLVRAHDAQVFDALGSVLLRRDLRLSAEAYRTERALDPDSAAGYGVEAEVDFHSGQPEQALKRLEDCLRLSPAASGCLYQRMVLLSALGRCQELEGFSRSIHQLRPDLGMFSLRFRSFALLALDADASAIAPVLQQQVAARFITDATAADLLDWYFGRLGTLASRLAGSPNGTLESEAWRAQVLLEEGDDAQAAAVARSSLVRVPQRGVPLEEEVESELLLLLRRIGGLDAKEHVRLRQRGVDRLAAQQGGNAAGALDAWARLHGSAHAFPPADVAEAALESPLARQVTEETVRRWLLSEAEELNLLTRYGTIVFAAGQHQRAAELLSQAARVCSNAGEVGLFWLLGQALEAVGRRDEACQAYGRVLRRWGSATPRSVTAEGARARSEALACPPPALQSGTLP